MMNTTFKHTRESREIRQAWCIIILTVCWAVITLIVGITLVIAVIRDVRKNYPRPESELTAFYPDPVCEFCGAVMDGREHCSDEVSALTVVAD